MQAFGEPIPKIVPGEFSFPWKKQAKILIKDNSLYKYEKKMDYLESIHTCTMQHTETSNVV